MAVNKVEYGDETLIDLTNDTVDEETVLEGEVFHSRSGEQKTGKAVIPKLKTIPLSEYIALSKEEKNNGTYYHVIGDNGSILPLVRLTKAEYDALGDKTLNDHIIYDIYDMDYPLDAKNISFGNSDVESALNGRLRTYNQGGKEPYLVTMYGNDVQLNIHDNGSDKSVYIPTNEKIDYTNYSLASGVTLDNRFAIYKRNGMCVITGLISIANAIGQYYPIINNLPYPISPLTYAVIFNGNTGEQQNIYIEGQSLRAHFVLPAGNYALTVMYPCYN